jgi:uncharacterized protein
MLARLLLLVAAAYLLYRGLRATVQQLAGSRRAVSSPGARPQVVAKLIRCAHCGVHVPQERALQHAGRSFCSTACEQSAAAGES